MEFNQKSMKNIPLLTEKLYKVTSVNKDELIVKRMSWKAHLYQSNIQNRSNPLHFILENRHCPPQHKDLIPFDLIKFVKSVNFWMTCKQVLRSVTERYSVS